MPPDARDARHAQREAALDVQQQRSVGTRGRLGIEAQDGVAVARLGATGGAGGWLQNDALLRDAVLVLRAAHVVACQRPYAESLVEHFNMPCKQYS